MYRLHVTSCYHDEITAVLQLHRLATKQKCLLHFNFFCPCSNQLVVPNNATWDFVANIFFFFLLPVFLVVGIAKVVLSSCSLKPVVARKLPVTATKLEKPENPASKTENSAPAATPGSDPKPKRLRKPVTLAANVPKLKEIPKLIAHAPKSKGTPKLTANTPKLTGSSKKSKTKSSK